MTKAQIIEIVHQKTGMPRREAAAYVETTFSLIKSVLESGESLKISGFGSFIVKDKASRRGRNPHTGESVTIKARRVVTFKTSAVLREAINTPPQ